jgi:hypothetical protein
MALILRRAAEQFPRANWEPNNEHLVVMSGETVVGSLQKITGGTIGERWSWSVTCVIDDEPIAGTAARREEAQAQFAASGGPG